MKLLLSLLCGACLLGWAIYQQRQKELRESPDRLERLRKLLREGTSTGA